MRFARVAAVPNQTLRGLGGAAASAGVQLLQLDYARRSTVEAESLDSKKPLEFAPAFADQLAALSKELFLDNQLCVVSNAGWDNALFCVEGAAQALQATGNGDLLITAVRGSNLLPILDFLRQDGVDLSNCANGRPISELRDPILTAELELGGGPLAMGLADGARVVVAGCYDPIAPLCAAGAVHHGWSWSDYDRLAGAALAARAAAWPEWCAAVSPSGRRRSQAISPLKSIVLDREGSARLDFPHPVRSDAAQRLADWLRRRQLSDPARHSDATCDFSAIQCAATAPSQLELRGAAGVAGDELWRLNIIYRSGFAAEAMLAASIDDASFEMNQLVDHLRDMLSLYEAADAQVELTAWSGETAAPRMAALACRSQQVQPCADFVADLQRFVESNRDVAAFVGGVPRVHATSRLWPTRVPCDAIDLAVDTRLVKDWL